MINVILRFSSNGPILHRIGLVLLLTTCCYVVSRPAPNRSKNVLPAWIGRRDFQETPPVLEYLIHQVLSVSRGGSSEVDEDADWLKIRSVVDLSPAVSDPSGKGSKRSESDINPDHDTESGSEGVLVSKDEVMNGNDDEESETYTEENQPTWTFPAAKPGDGSESDPDGLPTRFLLMQKNHREHAKQAFQATLEWRRKNEVDTILSRPQPKFDVCKYILPHYFPGRDATNYLIFVQRPGQIDLELAHRNNVTMDDLLTHYIYVLEYCWNILEPGPPDGVMTNVLDLRGVNFRTLQNAEIMSFLKHFVQMMSANYPSRSHKTFIINAPRWFGGIYRLIKPLLRESTKKKIEIFARGPRQDAALRQLLDASLPKELLSTSNKGRGKKRGKSHSDNKNPDDGGGGAVTDMGQGLGPFAQIEPGPHSAMEREFRSFCLARLKEHGVEMQAVV